MPVHRSVARVRGHHSAENFHERGFARAVAAHQSHDLAGRRVYGNLIQSHSLRGPAERVDAGRPECFADIVYLQHSYSNITETPA